MNEAVSAPVRVPAGRQGGPRTYAPQAGAERLLQRQNTYSE